MDTFAMAAIVAFATVYYHKPPKGYFRRTSSAFSRRELVRRALSEGDSRDCKFDGVCQEGRDTLALRDA